MDTLALGLILVGTIVSGIGAVWILVVAFQNSILWPLAILFIPIVGLVVFLIKCWGDARKPFLIGLAGLVLLSVGEIIDVLYIFSFPVLF